MNKEDIGIEEIIGTALLVALVIGACFAFEVYL